MRSIAKFITILSIIVIAVGFPVVVSAAPTFAPVHQETAPTLPSLPDLLESGKNLGGIALFFAALINLGKFVKPEIFPDGSAPKYNLVIQTVVLVSLVVAQITGRADLVPIIDQNAGILATILSSVLALIYQLWISRKGHEEVLAGLPGVGFSLSNRKAGETAENQVLEITNAG